MKTLIHKIIQIAWRKRDWIAKKTGSQFRAGLAIGAIVTLCVGAGATNLGPVSSLLVAENPLSDPQAELFYTEIDELEATDGSGLDELKTANARAGAALSFYHSTAGVELQYRLRSGSPSQDLPQVVVPGDNGTSGLYWDMVGDPQKPGYNYLIDNNGDFYAVALQSDNGVTRVRVDQSATAITD